MRFTFSLPVWSIFAVQCLASALTVTITNGTVVGRYLPSFEQDLFLGVPYSDPPLRFQNSVGRTTKFSGDFDARYVYIFFTFILAPCHELLSVLNINQQLFIGLLCPGENSIWQCHE